MSAHLRKLTRKRKLLPLCKWCLFKVSSQSALWIRSFKEIEILMCLKLYRLGDFKNYSDFNVRSWLSIRKEGLRFNSDACMCQADKGSFVLPGFCVSI